MRTDRPALRRPGFTLVELLVVVGIIAILVALTTAAAQRMRDKGRELQVVADCKQLEDVMSTFRSKYGVLPPSFGAGQDSAGAYTGTFRLASAYKDLRNNWLVGFNDNSPEIIILRRLFPRIDLTDTGLRAPVDYNVKPIEPTQWSQTNLASAGYGLGCTRQQPVLLDMNQMMVFFLSGGSFTGYSGFSTDPARPFKAPVQGEARKDGGSFMEFPQDRMVKPEDYNPRKHENWRNGYNPENNVRFAGDTGDGNREPWFVDPWGHPYLYLSTYNGNDYPFDGSYQNAVLASSQPPPINGTQLLAALRGPVLVSPWGGKGSLSGGTYGPHPYRESKAAAAVVKFVNGKSFQIISMGKDAAMGPGGSWRDGATVDSYAENKVGGGDDFANFADRRLGAVVQDD